MGKGPKISYQSTQWHCTIEKRSKRACKKTTTTKKNPCW